MKIFKTILGLCFLSILVGLPVQSVAESDLKSEINIDRYGIVDGVFPGDSRIVVHDTNLHYTLSSAFFDKSGAPISDIRKSLKVGTPVVVQYYQKSSGLVLQKLQIISRSELETSGMYHLLMGN